MPDRRDLSFRNPFPHAANTHAVRLCRPLQIDGMGTNNRSKAFHDVAWHDLKMLASRIAFCGTKQLPPDILGTTFPASEFFGTSAGGRVRWGALLFHPEFYKVAVSNSGCHDNRMDKIWWNEQWMGWPIGPQYSESSNVDNCMAPAGQTHASRRAHGS